MAIISIAAEQRRVAAMAQQGDTLDTVWAQDFLPYWQQALALRPQSVMCSKIKPDPNTPTHFPYVHGECCDDHRALRQRRQAVVKRLADIGHVQAEGGNEPPTVEWWRAHGYDITYDTPVVD